MASPTGYNTQPGVATPITNAVWVAIANPNFATAVVLTADADFWVRFEQPQPAAGATGMRVWNRTYYGKEKSSGPLGYTQKTNEVIPDIGPVWVRAVAGATTVYSDWFRE